MVPHMSKTISLCIWIAYLTLSVTCIGSSQSNSDESLAILSIVNHSPIGISWDVIDGYTWKQVNIKPGGSDSFHLRATTYWISRDNKNLTMGDVNSFRQIQFPCDERIKLMLENKSIEIGGSRFNQEAVGGHTYNLTLY